MRNLFVILLTILLLSISVRGQKINLDSGLVACYPFNGNANDQSGNGYNGIVNGATLTSDRFGNPNSAYTFNGINNYIYAPDNPTFRVKSVTLAGWFYPYDEISRGQHLFSKVLGHGTWESYCLLTWNYDILIAAIADNSESNQTGYQMSSVANPGTLQFLPLMM